MAVFISDRNLDADYYYLNRHAEFDGYLWVLGSIGLILFPLNVECASFIMVYEERSFDTFPLTRPQVSYS